VTLVVLGPQRRPSLRPVMRSLDVAGPVAVVNAGWRDREEQDGELLDLLDGRGVNLALHARYLDVLDTVPGLPDWAAARQEALDELSSVYELRLHHALAAVHALLRRRPVDRAPGDGAVVDVAVADAIRAVVALDEWHVTSVREVRATFAGRLAELDHRALDRQCEQVAGLLAPAEVLVVAGGHVGVLLDCLRMFGVHPVDRAVVAWSAGAMALADLVVLFHDFAPQGQGHPEVHDVGLGVLRGVVPLPHARRRLRLDDHARMAVLAARLAPARCLVLDDGVRLALGPRGELPPGARIVDRDGQLATVGRDAA
jgi:hypothetical protein